MKREAGRQTGKWVERFIMAVLVATTIPSLAQSEKPAGIDHPHRVVLVSIPHRRLAVLEDGKILAQFPVAVGSAATPSPAGEFQIINRVSHPTYYHPGTVIPSGKSNPLGTRWVGLSHKGYGIHGTNAPGSVGHAASHGCIRLRNRDMESLFIMLSVGDVVQIREVGDEQVSRVFGNRADETTEAAAKFPGQYAGQ